MAALTLLIPLFIGLENKQPLFENMSVEEAVKFLLDVKEDLGGGRFRVEKAEDLEEVFDYYDYSEYEKKLIRELFDCEN